MVNFYFVVIISLLFFINTWNECLKDRLISDKRGTLGAPTLQFVLGQEILLISV